MLFLSERCPPSSLRRACRSSAKHPAGYSATLNDDGTPLFNASHRLRCHHLYCAPRRKEGPMQPTAEPSRFLRAALLAVAVVLVGCLCYLAVDPSGADNLPTGLRRFARPGSSVTIAVVVAVLVALCVLSFRSNGARRSRNVPVTVVAGLAATSAVLGFSSFWRCHDATHPFVFQSLIWTVALVKGDVSDLSMGGHVCPSAIPDGLSV